MSKRRQVGCSLVLAVLLVYQAVPVGAFSGGAHALAGSALGQVAGSAEGAFVVGLASHTLLDAIPHYEYRPLTQVALMLGAGLIISQEYNRSGDMRLLAGAAGGVLPDVEHLLRKLGWQKRPVFPSHNGTLPHGSTTNVWHGIWLEAGLVGALVGLAF